MLKLARFLNDYKKQVILAPAFKLLEAILEVLIPTIMVLIVDKGVKNMDQPYILKIGAILLLIVCCGYGAAFVCQYNSAIVSQGFGTLLRNALFEKIGTFSHDELDKFGTPSLINRITSDINQLQLAVAMLLRLAVRVPFLCIGGVMMAMYLDLSLSTVIILILPFFALIIYLIMSRTIPLYKVVQKKLDSLAIVLRENLSGVRIIRAFARTGYENQRFRESNNEYADTAIRVGRISALMSPMTNIIMNVSVLAILWFGGMRVDMGDMTQGQIIAYINYNTLVLSALIIVANLVVTFTKAAASAARVNEVFDTEASITDIQGESAVSVSVDVKAPILEFKDVSYMYNDSSEYSIKNISFKINAGETVGIIGGTGSGKSTLINLIPRFYEVSKGEILVKGIDVRNYMQKELRGKIGLVPQKAVLFSGTVEENIRWGQLEAKAEEVKKAAEIAQASSFIESLKDGYKTKITQGGTNLSGGQKQRLTIARALVRQPEILMLDDSSSALDYATDAALRKAIKNSTEDMTVIMVTQRVSTIKNADKIIVMDDGEMVGIGTHEELMGNCEVYKEIYVSQLER